MIEHLIRLIEHESAHIAQRDESRVHHLDEATGRGDQYFKGPLKASFRLFHCCPAEKRTHTQTGRVGEGLEGLGYLLSQFAGGHHHDGTWFPIDHDGVALKLKCLEPMQDRQGIGDSFSTPRFGDTDHGASGKQGRHRPCLDLGGPGQVPFHKGLLKGGEQCEIEKGVHD